jgi:hypothetical protein
VNLKNPPKLQIILPPQDLPISEQDPKDLKRSRNTFEKRHSPTLSKEEAVKTDQTSSGILSSSKKRRPSCLGNFMSLPS